MLDISYIDNSGLRVFTFQSSWFNQDLSIVPGSLEKFPGFTEEDLLSLEVGRYKEDWPDTSEILGVPVDPSLAAPKWDGAAWIEGDEQKKLDSLKDIQRESIRKAYVTAADAPVTDANGNVWHGGWDSAIKLDAAYRLAEKAGLSSVTFYDVDNVGHDLPLVDADSVVQKVASAFQSTLAKKQGYMRDIATATTTGEVEAVIWS